MPTSWSSSTSNRNDAHSTRFIAQATNKGVRPCVSRAAKSAPNSNKISKHATLAAKCVACMPAALPVLARFDARAAGASRTARQHPAAPADAAAWHGVSPGGDPSLETRRRDFKEQRANWMSMDTRPPHR